LCDALRPFLKAEATQLLKRGLYKGAAVDLFMEQMRGRLDTLGITGTNFEITWQDVLEERADSDAALRRRFEALLGVDPDEGSPTAIEQLVVDSRTLGRDSMGEIAADHFSHGSVLTAKALAEIADLSGFCGAPSDVVRLAAGTNLPRCAEVPAWRLGAEAAKLLRQQERLETDPISDLKLAAFAGLSETALHAEQKSGELSFILDAGPTTSRTVFRSK